MANESNTEEGVNKVELIAREDVASDPDDCTDDSADDCEDTHGDELADEEALARINELTARLDHVMGALSDTEEVNILLQEEIKQLLKEQDEQDELRNELHAELTERGELMQRMVRQTISDSTDSTNILDRIQMLRAESEQEKLTFAAEMAAIDSKLRLLDSPRLHPEAESAHDFAIARD